MPNTEPDPGLAGEPLPNGELDRDPGGLNVDANNEAADGFDLRKGKLASDWDSGRASIGDWRVLGSLIVDAAKGSVGNESVGEASSPGDCIESTRWY